MQGGQSSLRRRPKDGFWVLLGGQAGQLPMGGTSGLQGESGLRRQLCSDAWQALSSPGVSQPHFCHSLLPQHSHPYTQPHLHHPFDRMLLVGDKTLS